jgi:lipoprotein-anchoring transpeptidase ErfK/SrfK
MLGVAGTLGRTQAVPQRRPPECREREAGWPKVAQIVDVREWQLSARGRQGGRGRRQGWLLVAALGVAAVLVAGCAGDGGKDEDKPAASISVSPAAGTKQVRPDAKVTVTVRKGTIREVRVVDEDGERLAGTLNQEKTGWTATRPLAPNTDYKVTASATDDRDRLTASTTTFSTLQVPKAKQLKPSTVSPLRGSVVGVAQPVVVGFNRPVPDRAAIQRTLRVETSPTNVEGAWYWIDNRYVHFRPKSFWPADTKVTLHANTTGVDAGEGYWGAQDRTISFTIGRPQIIRVDAKKLTMTVERSGKRVRAFPITSGKPGWETRNGIKVIMEKVTDKTWTNDEIDAPEEYTLKSKWALRMTNSGEFIHDAAWSLQNFGRANASHGCVGMKPADAAWLYQNTIVGDAVVVTNSPRLYKEIYNRYADWNIPWATWSAGNA